MSAAPVMFVNVFDVEPANQNELVDLLTEAIDRIIRHRPGFIAARLLVAGDDRTVINETTWADQAAVAATQTDSDAAVYALRASALATPRPGVYRAHAQFEA